MWNSLLNAVGAAGNVLDLPGSSARDVLAGRNPLDQWMTPLTDKNRTSGRDLLRVHGLASNKDTWGNFAGGMLAEAAMDPLNFIPGMSVAKAAKAKGVAQAANRGIDAANATSMSQRAAGFMPEEVIPHLHPSVLESPGVPKKFYHGGPDISFSQYDPQRLDKNALYGQGIYATDSPHVAGGENGYWAKGIDKATKYEVPEHNRALFEQAINVDGGTTLDGLVNESISDNYVQRAYKLLATDGRNALLPPEAKKLLQKSLPPAGVKMHYVNIKKPLNMEAIYAKPQLPVPQLLTSQRNIVRGGVSDARAAKEQMDYWGSVTDEELIAKIGRVVPKERLDNFRMRFYNEAADLAEVSVAGPFRDRNVLPDWLAGEDIYERLSRNDLESAGYDGIVHEGGHRVGGMGDHNVAIAFNPEQMHLPYIAKSIQPRKRIPSMTPSALQLALYNAVSRSAAQSGRNK